MKKIVLDNYEYEVIENINDCLDIEKLKDRYTDYFYPYDYILGDYSYNSLILKGFYEKNNPSKNSINDISLKDKYIKEYCTYGCSYFLLKKTK
jgi:uncharacterized protein YutD